MWLEKRNTSRSVGNESNKQSYSSRAKPYHGVDFTESQNNADIEVLESNIFMKTD